MSDDGDLRDVPSNMYLAYADKGGEYVEVGTAYQWVDGERTAFHITITMLPVMWDGRLILSKPPKEKE